MFLLPVKPEHKYNLIVLFTVGHVTWTAPLRIRFILSPKLSLVCSRVIGRSTWGVCTGLISNVLKLCSAYLVFSRVKSKTLSFCFWMSSLSWSDSLWTDRADPSPSEWIPFTSPFWLISGNWTLAFCEFGSQFVAVLFLEFIFGKVLSFFIAGSSCPAFSPVSVYLLNISLFFFCARKIIKDF